MNIFQRMLFKLANLLKNAESAWMYSRLKACGSAVRIDSRVFIWSPENVEFGSNVDINGYTVIYGSGGVQIENNVMIGANCVITSVTHPIEVDTRHQIDSAQVRMLDNCWLGAGVVVLPGVTIGKNTIVAAGSVVTKSIPDNCVCAGVPVKVKRTLNKSELCEV